MSRLDCDDDHLLTVLTSLCQVAKLQPQVFATSHKRIVNNFVVKKLMTVDRVCGCGLELCRFRLCLLLLLFFRRRMSLWWGKRSGVLMMRYLTKLGSRYLHALCVHVLTSWYTSFSMTLVAK